MYEAKFVLSLDFGNRAHLPEWCCPCRIPWYRIVEIAFEQIEIYILFTMRFSLCLLESNQAKPWRSLDEPSQDKTSQAKTSQAKPSQAELRIREEKRRIQIRFLRQAVTCSRLWRPRRLIERSLKSIDLQRAIEIVGRGTFGGGTLQKLVLD